MRNACDVTNVVEAANTDGRQDRLENMLLQLEQCQKALQVCRQAQALQPGLIPVVMIYSVPGVAGGVQDC